MLLESMYDGNLWCNGSKTELVTEDAIDMSKTTIQFATMREMLALAGDIQNMRVDFSRRLERLLAGIGKSLRASRATAYCIGGIDQVQQASPLLDLRSAASGILRRSNLVGTRLGSFRLDAMCRAENVTTMIGVPAWTQPLTLRSLVGRRHHLHSTQFVHDSLSVAILFERTLRQPAFTPADKAVVDMMWHSFRVVQKPGQNVVSFLRQVGAG
jgi:hypothetical protein